MISPIQTSTYNINKPLNQNARQVSIPSKLDTAVGNTNLRPSYYREYPVFQGSLDNQQLKVRQIIDRIKKAKTVAIFLHKNPDSDSLGSAIILKSEINRLYPDKIVDIISEPISDILMNSHGLSADFLMPQNHRKSYQVGIAIDCASLPVICDSELYNKSRCRINIDHHKTNTNLTGKQKFANIFLVDPSCISTTYLLKKEFFNRSTKFKLNQFLAKNLLIGLEVDRVATEGNLSDSVNDDISKLIKDFKIDIKGIWNSVNSQLKLSFDEMKAYGTILESARLADGTVYAIIDNNHNPSINLKKVINKVLISLTDLNNINAAAIFYKDGDKINASLRGKNINVGEIAEEFGGGGHDKAAGFKMNDSIENVVKIVLSKIKDKTLNL